MSGVRVLKFGGAALRDGPAVRRAVAIVRRSGGERPVVVVSAVGDVTRRLEEALAAARDGRLAWDALRVRHRSLLRELDLPGDLLDRHLFALRGLLVALAGRDRGAPPEELAQARRVRDQVLSFGERMSARVFAAALSQAGARAVPIDAFDAGLVARSGALEEPARAAERVRRALLHEGSLPVVTGFVALDAGGHVTTLGRNGSDLSAVWIGAALEADEVQLWKEVPGILRADPRLVEEAEPLPLVGRADAEALARHGASVLHPGALAPAQGTRVAVWLRDVRDPEGAGTRIVEETAFAGPLAIAHKGGLCLVELGADAPAAAGGTRAGAMAALFESMAGAGAELVACQADALGVRALFTDARVAAGGGALRLRHGLARVGVVGRDLAQAGDLEERVLARARALDPGACAWREARSLAVVLDEARAADCVRALHDELFGRRERLGPVAG